MNKTTLLALEWLKSKGIDTKDLVISGNQPIITHLPTNQKYVVKYLYHNKILFSVQQRNMLDGNDTILVFNRQNVLADQFLWKDKGKARYHIVIVNYRIPQVDYVTIRGVTIGKDVENEMNKYMDLLKPFVPTVNEIVNRSALIGLKILSSTHKYKSTNDLNGAINIGKITAENIIKEMF
jgi:hypothetical protein